MSANLMIVEDDDRVRSALRLAMEDEGYDVAEAEEAEDALEHLRDNGAPDVMIVDLMLGEMDGFTCIREIRRDHDVPIIVVSARDDTHDVVAALEAGADDFVTKPFEIKEITARMRAPLFVSSWLTSQMSRLMFSSIGAGTRFDDLVT